MFQKKSMKSSSDWYNNCSKKFLFFCKIPFDTNIYKIVSNIPVFVQNYYCLLFRRKVQRAVNLCVVANKKSYLGANNPFCELHLIEQNFNYCRLNPLIQILPSIVQIKDCN